ncbi:hypothetical protein [Streptomyces sp. NWU339]|uniref:hypothetical protein n=1 Tax=Streptomyces sp. NWU339 TaxID=2185284 RepID=UPI0011B41A3D|nr:hypothetical protein [Streptomyces sp. NWU339]
MPHILNTILTQAAVALLEAAAVRLAVQLWKGPRREQAPGGRTRLSGRTRPSDPEPACPNYPFRRVYSRALMEGGQEEPSPLTPHGRRGRR